MFCKIERNDSMKMEAQKVRIEKVDTNVDLGKWEFYVSLHLMSENKESIEIEFYEQTSFYSLCQILELYFDQRIVDVKKLQGKEMLIIKGKHPTDIAFSTPRSGRTTRWVIYGCCDRLYNKTETLRILKEKSESLPSIECIPAE